MIYAWGEDSLLLQKEVEKYSDEKKVLDVGCGSGIQMEAALDSGASEAFGVDIDTESVLFCKENGLNVVESDLFEKVEGRFDLIVFNPPYLPEDSREDSESSKITSGGKKGDEIIVRFLQGVGEYLAEEGKVLLVVSSLTPLGDIKKVLKSKGLEKKVVSSEKFFMEGLEVWEIQKT